MAEPIRLRARSIGPVAARALRGNDRGAVVAVFDRSFYARFGEQLTCIGGSKLWDGPLNVVCAGPAALGRVSSGLKHQSRHCRARPGNPSSSKQMDARAKPAHDDSIQLDLGQGVFSSLAIGDRICLAGPFSPSAGVRVSIDLHGARAWWPERPAENEFSAAPCSVTQQLQDRLVALTQVLSSPPAEGLAPLLFGIDTPLARAAQPAAEHIADVIFRKTAPAQARIAPLLGLGPGLTPSGDDYLGGVLIALRTLGREDDADRIWSVIEPIVAAATNDISRAHLAAAAEGFGSAPLHVLLNAIIDGQSEWLADFAAAVIRIGHTSGWDALTGAIAALRATVADESYCAAST